MQRRNTGSGRIQFHWKFAGIGIDKLSLLSANIMNERMNFSELSDLDLTLNAGSNSRKAWVTSEASEEKLFN